MAVACSLLFTNLQTESVPQTTLTKNFDQRDTVFGHIFHIFHRDMDTLFVSDGENRFGSCAHCWAELPSLLLFTLMWMSFEFSVKEIMMH